MRAMRNTGCKHYASQTVATAAEPSRRKLPEVNRQDGNVGANRISPPWYGWFVPFVCAVLLFSFTSTLRCPRGGDNRAGCTAPLFLVAAAVAETPSDKDGSVVQEECTVDADGTTSCVPAEKNKSEQVTTDTASSSSSSTSDSDSQCHFYMAESSIPNAGLGMYTSIPLPPNTPIAHPDLVIQLIDSRTNFRLHQIKHNAIPSKMMQKRNRWLLDDYFWEARNTGGTFEATRVESIIPGLAMLANSHSGFVNAVMSKRPLLDNGKEGLHRMEDPGVGAFTQYHNLEFTSLPLTKHDKEQEKDADTNDATMIPAGMELFVDYGDEWFETRQTKYGFDMPLVGIQNKRVQKALPQDGLESSDGSNTTMSSLPNVVRSLEWLRNNGMCLDNIQPGDSTIEQAGRGAFATRMIQKGDVIAPAPLVHIRREHLHIYYTQQNGDEKDDDDKKEEVEDVNIYKMGEQLLLNYCYGHPNSSLLLFPYSPVVNFINHHDENANAEFRWSTPATTTTTTTMSFHQSDWLNKSVEELMEENHTGLLLEIVATKDISPGDEIFLNYGSRWADAWSHHVQSWEPVGNADTYVPAFDLDDEPELRTVEEQEESPYPSNVMTVCYVKDDVLDQEFSDDGMDGTEYEWEPQPDLFRYTDHAAKCDILSKSNDDDGDIVYTARVYWPNDEDFVVRNIPRVAIEFMDREYTTDQHMRNAFRHEIHLPDEIFPKAWMDLDSNGKKKADVIVDVEGECGLYLATSSIPNSGLGMFSAVDINTKEDIFYPEIVLQVEDFELNNKHRRNKYGRGSSANKYWLLNEYYWEPRNTRGIYEAEEIESFIPGLGMLANSHPGLVNAIVRRPDIDSARLHRSEDHGAGAFSLFHNVRHVASGQIPAGMELFVEYGDDWFEEREGDFDLIPLSDDYEAADEILKEFWTKVDGKADTVSAWKEWMLLREDADERIRAALPKSVKDVKRALDIGTAMFSVPDVVRSPEWLKKNGLCLDNIRPDTSTKEQAGRGAFATRPIKKGELITPAPLVHIHREHLEVYDDSSEDADDDDINYLGEQLLLNYCYGHPESSLLLFPYSPIVNFINHDDENPNAELRWSNTPHHRKNWMKKSVDDLLEEEHPGLMMEFVATRDISPGDEIFINYGSEWSEAWKNYVSDWEAVDDAEDYVAAHQMNDGVAPLRTEDEREENPYPDNLMTVCYLPVGIFDDVEDSVEGQFGETYEWYYVPQLLEKISRALPCDILRRENVDSDRESSIKPLGSIYTARVYTSSSEEYIVSHIPRYAVEFVDQQYTSDEYLRNVFRHEIEIPDEMFPEAWKDLK